MELAILVSQCDGGCHVHFDVTKDGGASKRFVMAKRHIFDIEQDSSKAIIIALIRNRLKTAGYDKNTPLGILKTAIESEVFKL